MAHLSNVDGLSPKEVRERRAFELELHPDSSWDRIVQSMMELAEKGRIDLADQTKIRQEAEKFKAP